MTRTAASTPQRVALLVTTIVAGMVIGAPVGVGSAAGLSLTSQPLTPYRTCTVTATPTTTSVVADTEVRQGSATTNYGTSTALTVTSSGSANRRVYIRFDLGSCTRAIPASATVRLATLRLYLTALPTVCRTLDLFRVTSTWTETGITWNSQPFGTSLNNPPSAARTDAVTVGTPVGCENRTSGTYVVGATVTADVAAFVAGGATNHGWMIRDDVEGSGTARTVTFSAKQLGTLSQAPQLVVTYVDVP